MYSCEMCDYRSYYEDELDEHIEEEHPTCDTCDRMFVNHNSLRQHYANSFRHNYCGICERHFQSAAALKGHQETHRPKDIKCPRCDRGFSSASAVAKHVELGKCFNLTQPQIVKKIRDWEVSSGNPNLLTVPRLGYSNDNGSPGPIQATEAAYNGSAYECYFCQRKFGSLNSLNQHLNYGMHLSKDFRCKKCGFTCQWLSGLIEHMESEKCGFLTRSQVRSLATPIVQRRLGN